MQTPNPTPKIMKSLDGNDEPDDSRTKIICNTRNYVYTADNSSKDDFPVDLLNKTHSRTATVESKTDDSTSCTCQKKVCTCTFPKDRKEEVDYYVPGKSKFCNCTSKTGSTKRTSNKKECKVKKELSKKGKGRVRTVPGQLETDNSKSGASTTKTRKGNKEIKTNKKRARNLKLLKSDGFETKTFSTDQFKTDDSKTDTSKTKTRKGKKEIKTKKKKNLNLSDSAIDRPKPIKTKLFSTDELLTDDSKTDTSKIKTHKVKKEKKIKKKKRASDVKPNFFESDDLHTDDSKPKTFATEPSKTDDSKTGPSKIKTDNDKPGRTTKKKLKKKKPKPVITTDDDDDDFPFPPITPDERVLPPVKYRLLEHPKTKQFKGSCLDDIYGIRIQSWGDSLKEAFEQCGMALYKFMVNLDSVEIRQRVYIEAEGDELIVLLYRFIEELRYLYSIPPHFQCKKLVITTFCTNKYGCFIGCNCLGEDFIQGKHLYGLEVEGTDYVGMKIVNEPENNRFEICCLIEICSEYN